MWTRANPGQGPWLFVSRALSTACRVRRVTKALARGSHSNDASCQGRGKRHTQGNTRKKEHLAWRKDHRQGCTHKSRGNEVLPGTEQHSNLFSFFSFSLIAFWTITINKLVRNTKRNKRTGNMVGCIPPFWKHETHGCFLFFRASERVATCLPAEGFFLSNYNKIPLSFNLQVLQSEKMANLSEISIQLYNYYLSPYTIQSANKMFRVHGITISKIYLCSIFHSEVVHHLKVRQ